ncbi:hypothetical protein P8935_15700 [Telmatobacter sp. DSM 110680]|uniref:Uncharacterized protein n=1 Tax=Telmatobacter sp. DSM 110680 TaxID=3036704 RepID=A0AAU7DFG6_9BACT
MTGEHIKAVEQINAEGADTTVTSSEVSLDSSPPLMMHGAHDELPASANAVTLSIQQQVVRPDLDIQNAGVPANSSISEISSVNRIDRASKAEPSDGRAFDTLRLTQALPTVDHQQTTIDVRNNVSNSRANAHSSSSAATSISTTRTISASIATHDEFSAPSYPHANRSEFGLATSSELTERTGKVTEVFGAIDERGPTSQWTLSGSRRAEAGFQDPSLGWVSVRAQAGAGGIHAVVIPASDAAGQVLNLHLAGLNAHLTPQYEHLNAVTMESPDTGLNSRDSAEHSAQHHGGRGTESDAQHSQEDSQSPRTSTAQNIPSPTLRMGIGRVQDPAITAGQMPGERHVSVIV